MRTTFGVMVSATLVCSCVDLPPPEALDAGSPLTEDPASTEPRSTMAPCEGASTTVPRVALDDFPVGTAPRLCAGTDKPKVNGRLPEEDASFLVHVDGVVTAATMSPQYNLIPCSPLPQDPPVVLSLTDAEGYLWWFGIRVLGADNNDVTPAISFTEGESLEVTLNMNRGSFSGDHGIAISDDDGLLVAFEELTGDLIPSEALTGLSVTRGEAIGPAKGGDCGTRQAYEQVFSADTLITLYPAEQGALCVDGVMMHVLAGMSWAPLVWECTDPVSPFAWFVWR